MTRTARRDPGQRVLEDRRFAWHHPERPGASKERVRRWFAFEMLALRDDPVDTGVERIFDTRRDQHVATVRARRHDRATQPGITDRPHIADRTLLRLDPPFSDHPHHDV